jgi:tRNA/tmRNA/rRNA uracil-C5-methylase (TrmA/RlmC/RlmD family)
LTGRPAPPTAPPAGSGAPAPVELEVGAVAHGGHCVARHGGRVVFVRHALPGERVRARLEPAGESDRFWRADAVEVLQASPDRVDRPCPLAGPGGCGGCDWQHASPAAQRRLKAAVLLEQLARLGGVDVASVPGLAGLAERGVEPVPGDHGGLGWRTRMRFAVDPTDGRVGLRRHRSHDLVEVPHCPIAHPEVNVVGVGRKPWRGVAALDVVATSSGERLVVVEPSTPGGRVSTPPLGAEAAVAVRGRDGLQRLRGRTWTVERVVVDGVPRTFRVTGSGFWQVHPGAAGVLVEAVLSAADLRPGGRAVDLYSGVGLFTAALAVRVGATGAVLGIEGDARVGADARRNLHDLPVVELVTGRVERALPELLAPGGPWAGPDVVVLDPPRAGAGRAVMATLLAASPRVVVYVACDPAALARDVAFAAGAGYHLAAVRAFDLFPMTQHLECVAVLMPSGRRRGPDGIS